MFLLVEITLTLGVFSAFAKHLMNSEWVTDSLWISLVVKSVFLLVKEKFQKII